MGIALLGLATNAVQGGTAGNFSQVVGNGPPANSAVLETIAQFYAPFACQISGLTSSQGPITAPFTLQLRRSGVNATAVISDTAQTSAAVDAYNNAQAFCLQWGGGTTGGVQRIQAQLQATAQPHGAIYASSHGTVGAVLTGGTTTYSRTSASTPGAQTTEGPPQAQIGCAGTLSTMYISIPTNTTTATSTFTSRINGANGNQSITVAAGLTSNIRVAPGGPNDAVNIGDLFLMQSVVGAGGSLNLLFCGYAFAPTFGNQNDVFAVLNGPWPSGTTYACIYGTSTVGGTLAASQIQPGFACSITRFCANVITNTATASGNVNLNKNGTVVQPNGITVAAGVTGWFVSGGGQTSFLATDLMCWAINGGSGGAITFQLAGMTFTTPAGYAASIAEVGAASDTVTSRSTFPETITEVGSAVDTPTSNANLFATVAEVGNAVDTTTSQFTAALAIVETGDAEDIVTSQSRYAVAIAETGVAQDTITTSAVVFDTIVDVLAAIATVESSAASTRAPAVAAVSATLAMQKHITMFLQASTNPIASLLANRLTPGNLEPFTATFPPAGPTTTRNIIQAYAYVQYQDDDSIQAFFQAYNEYTQAYLDYLNNIDLPIYTDDNITGSTLDWVAYNLYGFRRPVFITLGSPQRGPLNTWQLNTLPLNTYIAGVPASFVFANDDVYKRVITWHLYKEDGKVFNAEWLKRRVGRFIYGVNGTDPYVNPYAIGVTITGRYSATIRLPGGPMSDLFAQAVAQGVVELPFQITWATGQNDGQPLPTVPPDALLDTPAANPILDSNQDYILTGIV